MSHLGEDVPFDRAEVESFVKALQDSIIQVLWKQSMSTLKMETSSSNKQLQQAVF
jgi:hypothetical protein